MEGLDKVNIRVVQEVDVNVGNGADSVCGGLWQAQGLTYRERGRSHRVLNYNVIENMLSDEDRGSRWT
jgi:hypothetical protein